jgi:Gpi18-like mannosyltransferase
MRLFTKNYAILFFVKLFKTLARYTDLHDPENQKYIVYILFGLLVVLAFVARISLVHFKDGDYTAFSDWYRFIKIHGIHSFKYGASDGFSVYNPPYTYFLYLASLLPVSKLIAIKGLLTLFDIFLAVSVYYLVKVFKPRGNMPAVAALTTLFLPTVLVTGVMWGQFDQLYVGAMLFSLTSGLKDNSKWSWIWFGLAIAIKLQAIFFLPAVAIMCFKRINWHDAAWGVGAFLLVTLPPMLAGRSLGSLLNIYPNQVGLFNGDLVLNAPTMYQWFPNSAFPYFNHMATALAIAAAIAVTIYSVQHKKFSNKDILRTASLMLYLIPFLLPSMHERYFFPAGLASLGLAFAYPTVTYVAVAVLIQVITIFSYVPFLFSRNPPIPFSVLSLLILAIICVLTADFMGLKKQVAAKAEKA